MIAIFLTEKEAQEFSNKIHAHLSANCKNYNATEWQKPVPNKDKTQFFIQVPDEYYKPLYKDCEKIVITTKTEFDKKTLLMEKPDDTFTTVESVKG